VTTAIDTTRWDRRREREAERKRLGLDWREYLLHKAREWAERYGAPPTALDWNLAQARRAAAPERMAEIEARHAEDLWPGSSTVTKTFGGWNRFLTEAGLDTMRSGERRRNGGVSGRHSAEVAERHDRIEALWIEGKTAPEIAEALGISKGLVNSDVSRMRKAGRKLPNRPTGPPPGRTK
jgi:hypothetical protein